MIGCFCVGSEFGLGEAAAERAALPPAVLLMGPTAAGKTSLALALADRLPVALISVDSAQVYRGLHIGTAKPDRATLERYPHALIDLREPADTYSAADFLSDCRQAMLQAWAEGKLPLLVGGTTLYFRALLYGLDVMPAADPALRQALEERLRERGADDLHAELQAADPDSASRIRISDPQRLVRALEILRLSGRGPSHWQRDNRLPLLPTLRLVVTAADRSRLHERIGRRLEQMLEQGFLAEVEQLRSDPRLTPTHASMRAVGYRQAWELLDGRIDRIEWQQKTRAATRQLAKRQLTALRQMHTSLWYDPDGSHTFDRVFRRVQGFLRTSRRPCESGMRTSAMTSLD